MQIEESDLIHYGILRRSGRYPWGSGGNQNEVNKSFLDYLHEMRASGLTDSEIAKGIGVMHDGDPKSVSLLKLRALESIASNEQRASKIAQVQRLRSKGMSIPEIVRTTGIADTTVRGYLKPGAADKADVLSSTAKMLRNELDKQGLLDVGKGQEHFIGVSRTRLDTAVEILKEEGVVTHLIQIPQLGSRGQFTTTKVLGPKGTTRQYIYQNLDKIGQINSFTEDQGRTYGSLHPPIELDPSRVKVVFKEDGGADADGMIYVRPGVEDVSIGGASYAQVRVAVGPDHYLKGMALYKKDLPDGVDVEFHTSKSKFKDGAELTPLDAMKKTSDEPGYLAIGEHPLMKSIVRQVIADPGTPQERVVSAMNIVNEEGQWGDWSHKFSSQMLSKQSPTLAREQLSKTYTQHQKDFDEINSLTNDTVRKKLLLDFADEADSSAVHLKAAALPRTGTHVLLPVPVPGIKPSEIYAPRFNNGDKVVLIRHPHAGPFEIPELTVNNKSRAAKKVFGSEPRDAVGIHPSVAHHLSGADFDGDTVLVIKNNQGKIKHGHPLDQLKNFDPKREYPEYPGMTVMTEASKQAEMGKISNLITDMSIKGASHEELARAVKHSMVVIDAPKHHLNHKLSYQQNGIASLRKKYQTGGASTLLSRAGAKDHIPQQRPRSARNGGPYNLQTGEREYEPTGKLNLSGKPRLMEVRRLSRTSDARTLMSTATGTTMEQIYADHSNKMKEMARKARLEAFKIPDPKKSPSAAKAYKKEVDSLNSKLTIAEMNRPLERKAQAIANPAARARKAANPEMDDDTKKKIDRQQLAIARQRVGAKKHPIEISADEWDAIQAGAISNSKLIKILNESNMDIVRKLASPKRQHLMTPSKIERARLMLSRGDTRADVARALGVSLTTLDVAMKGG